MRIALERDAEKHLLCTLGEGERAIQFGASNAEDALADFSTALDRLSAEGVSECFWEQATGHYRWVFRRNGDATRVALLWGAGTLTGWEHIYWEESNGGEMAAEISAAIAKAQAV